MDFQTMMRLEQHGADTFVGTGPRYPWGGLYGGQIVAQALRAAGLTVEPKFRVHSLHAYFIRRGDASEPIRFEVDRTRNGRSFVTRTVVARQAVGAILTLSASFAVDEAGIDAQVVAMPDVPSPDAVEASSWSPMFERHFTPAADVPGRAAAWLRMTEPIGDDPFLHACALAYLSDDIPTDAVVGVARGQSGPAFTGEDDEDFYSASLDHAIWFHRPVRSDVWQLHDFVSHGFLSSRGLGIGHVFDADGVHLATISQEVLLRGKP